MSPPARLLNRPREITPELDLDQFRAIEGTERFRQFKKSETLERVFDQLLVPLSMFSLYYVSPKAEYEVKIWHYTRMIESYRDRFIAMVSSRSKRASTLDLENCVRLSGLQGSRNFVYSSKLIEEVLGIPLPWKKDSPELRLKPQQVLSSAIEAESFFDPDSRYGSVAFYSGFVFDYLRANSHRQRGPHIQEIDQRIKQGLAQGLKNAEKVFSIAGTSAYRPTSLYMHFITVGLMLEAGKIALAIAEPRYLKDLEFYQSHQIGHQLQMIWETQKYGTHHRQVASLLAFFSPALESAWRVIHFGDIPDALVTKPDLHALAFNCLSGLEA